MNKRCFTNSHSIKSRYLFGSTDGTEVELDPQCFSITGCFASLNHGFLISIDPFIEVAGSALGNCDHSALSYFEYFG